MRAAEAAVEWAKRPCERAPEYSNYEVLHGQVLTVAHMGHVTDPGGIRLADLPYPDMPGLAAAYWPCLSRLMVMGVPALGGWIAPHLDPALDGQAGTTWLQLQFADVTGHRPQVRSWRHAKGAMAR